MISMIDAYALAQTKLRTRKVRTGITIAISGLLFSLAATVAIVSDGVFTSFENMSSKSLAGRYIIGGNQGFQDTSSLYTDPEVIAKAESEHKKLVEAKKAEAKRLNIEYDPASDPAPTETIDGRKQVVYNSELAQKIMNEFTLQKYSLRTLEDFKTFAQKYNPTRYYSVYSMGTNMGEYTEMLGGKEKFTTEAKPNDMSQGPSDLSGPTLVPNDLISNYIFKDYKWNPDSGRIPVVVTQKRATA